MSDVSWIIKRLAAEDVDLMRKLNVCFSRAFEDIETYTQNPPDDSYLNRLLAKPSMIVLVALNDNNVIGGLVAYQLEKFEQPRSEMYLYDLAVEESHRRQGIATALIQELKAVAKSVGAYEVFVQADYGDDPAVSLYTGLGVREEVMHFGMPT